MFARSPKLAPLVLCALLFAASWIAFPNWPLHWLMTIRNSPVHASPMRTSLGAAGLVGLLRWRRPEARLLVAMTIIPHGLEFYDEIPLWLVAATRREAMLHVCKLDRLSRLASVRRRAFHALATVVHGISLRSSRRARPPAKERGSDSAVDRVVGAGPSLVSARVDGNATRDRSERG